jgi:lysophospholipid hydrolase
MDGILPASGRTTSNVEVLAQALITALKLVPTILFHIITFVTMTVPAWLYNLLSVSLTVTVNFTTLAMIVLAFVSTVSYFIRYRYHSYARGTPDPPRKEAEIEVPDVHASESKAGLSNYLDEFLSAIKVFGYLER